MYSVHHHFCITYFISLSSGILTTSSVFGSSVFAAFFFIGSGLSRAFCFGNFFPGSYFLPLTARCNFFLATVNSLVGNLGIKHFLSEQVMGCGGLATGGVFKGDSTKLVMERLGEDFIDTHFLETFFFGKSFLGKTQVPR